MIPLPPGRKSAQKPWPGQNLDINLTLNCLRPLRHLLLFLSLTANLAHATPPPSTDPNPAENKQAADNHYAQAIAALAADQPERARQLLEQVIAQRPNFAGAWLDLAIATYRSGDAAAALEHLDHLRTRFNLPPVIATQVDHWYRLWQSIDPTPSRPGWQGEIFSGIGYDSNANAGLNARQIPVTLAGSNVILDVDSASLPRADNFWSVALGAWGPAHSIGNGRINPAILLNSKQLHTESDYNTLDLQPGLVYEQAVGTNGAWQTALFARHYRLGSKTLFNGLRLTTLRHQTWSACRWTLGGEIDNRQHQRVASLGGTRYSLIAGFGCRLSTAGNLSATLKTGQEKAQEGRAGGDHHINELALLYDQPINSNQRLQASWQLIGIKDQEGYSPLLENNAKRRQYSQAIDLSLRQAITPHWEARLSYAYLQQRANLALFAQQGHLIMLGLAYRFD